MSNKSFSIKENPYMKDIQGGEKKVMKKILSVALSTAMAFSMFASVAFGADAEKLTPEQQFNVLKEAGIVDGFPDGLAHLDQTVTRAQLAKIIVKSLALEEVTGVASYKDKNYTAKHWAAPFIEAATKAGILEGVSTNPANPLFNPTGNVTVQELAKVLVVANKLEVPTEANNTASEWAKGYVAAAIKAGYIAEGINYQASATRAQTVVAAHAIYEFNNFKVTKAVAKDANNVTLTLSTGEVVEVKLEKALEKNKETELTYKAKDGRELKYSVTWFVTDATKVESVKASNLKEILVTFDGDVTKEQAEKITNYKLDDTVLNSASSATLQADGKSVLINLNTEGPVLTNQKVYKLTVSGFTGIASASFDFSALDVTVPEVSEVEVLGNKVLNVKFSEPVTASSATTRVNYKVDGYVANGEIKLAKDGKTATITLYSRLKAGDHKVSISGVKDYAGMTIINYLDKEITVAEDTKAPESITIEKATLDTATVKFSEAVDADTVKAANIYWSDNAGTVKFTADSVSATDATFTTYTVNFASGKKLPARETTLYVESVSDLHGNTASKLSTTINASVDVTRPEIASLEPATDQYGKHTTNSAQQLDIKFNKSIDKDQFSAANSNNLIVKNAKNEIVAVANGAISKANAINTLTVTLSNRLTEGTTYTVEVKNVVDGTALSNKIIPATYTITVPQVSAPEVKNVAVSYNAAEGTKIQVVYDKAMALDGEYSILKSDRYMIQVGGAWYLLPTGTTFQPSYDSKAVIINIPTDALYNGISKLGLNSVTGVKMTLVSDQTGNKLSGLTKEVLSTSTEWGAVTANIKATETKATAKNKVKVVFDRPLQVVYASDFKVNGVEPVSATYETVDGEGVVTLTLGTDLPAAVVANVTTNATGIRTLDLLGNTIVAGTTTVVQDGVAPSLVATNPVVAKDAETITVSFDEELVTTLSPDQIAANFIIKTGLNQTDILIPGKDYDAAIDSNDAKIVNITLKKVVSNLQKVTVATNDNAVYIFDANAVTLGGYANANKIKFGSTDVFGVNTLNVVTAPTVSGVTNNAVVKTDVTPTFTTGTATLKKDSDPAASFTSGTLVSAEGVYVLTVTNVGKVTTVKFTIDKTAPSVTALTAASATGFTVTHDDGTIAVTNTPTGVTATVTGNVVALAGTLADNDTVTFTVTDVAGNITTKTVEYDATNTTWVLQ